ncbi:hypothetical protein [Streptomyces kaempferi]|uniref:Uncharacterized protein n=1 Tax=Streptomyces kaempferi TaxID=333725 RepID=A0ABW3XWN2_9ACTN
MDRFYTGPGRRARSTVRKLTKLDGSFAFLEQRHAGEITRGFGARVESPVGELAHRASAGDRLVDVHADSPPSATFHG